MKLSELFNLIEDKKDGRFDIALRSGDEESEDQLFSVLDTRVMKTADGWILIFEVDE
jgi:hypothetical protein